MKNTVLIFTYLFLGAFIFYPKTHEAQAAGIHLYADVIGAAAGATFAGLDLKISKSSTFGPTVLLVDDAGAAGTVSQSGTGFGARWNYFLGEEALDGGFLLSTSALYAPIDYSITVDDVKYSGSANTVVVGTSIGYQIRLLSILRIKPAIGVAYYSASSSATLTSSTGATTSASVGSFSGVGPLIELHAGLAF